MNAPLLRRCLLIATAIAAFPAGAQSLAEGLASSPAELRNAGPVERVAAELAGGGYAVAADAGATGDGSGFYVSAATLPARFQSASFNPASAHLDRSGTAGSSKLITAGWADPGASWWQPQVSYVLQQDPASAQTGFGATDIPGQDGRNALDAHNVAAEWSVSGLRLGYRLSNTLQRAIDSNVSRVAMCSQGRAAYAGRHPMDRLDLQLDFGTDQVRTVQAATAQSWASQTISAQWQFDAGVALSSSLYQGRAAATAASPAMRTQLADVTLTYALGRAARDDSVAYLRLEQQALAGDGIVFTSDAPQTSRRITVGLSMPF
jgi:hypothetical protein